MLTDVRLKFPILGTLALEGNPCFSAGFGLAIMGTGLALLRGAGKTAVTMAKRHLLITLEVTSKDRAYPWVLQWLTDQAQHTSLGQHLSVQTVVKKLANGRTTTLFEFLPSTGTHIVQYNGRLVMVDRVREQQTVDLQTGQPWEAVSLGRSLTLCLSRSRSRSRIVALTLTLTLTLPR